MSTLAGNWKLHKTRADVKDFFLGLDASVLKEATKKNHSCIVACSDVLIESAAKLASTFGIKIFSQNVSYAVSGALTGETSPAQIKDSGASGTLIAHSERRQFFGETDATALKRALTALENDLEVIFCVGESLSERQNGDTKKVLEKQLSLLRSELFPHLGVKQKFQLAYEPVWAIGTGLVAEGPQIKEAHAWIAEICGEKTPPILYGGSVKPSNFKEILSIPRVDGGLVGGASLKASDYMDLLKACF